MNDVVTLSFTYSKDISIFDIFVLLKAIFGDENDVVTLYGIIRNKRKYDNNNVTQIF